MHQSIFEIFSIPYSKFKNPGMATQEDRSLASGITISKWMKNKMDSKFDFDQSAFSPTELDDSFMFHYFHPKKNESKMIASNLPENINVTVSRSDRNLDIARHPTPCQKYLIEGNHVPPPPQTTPQMKIKSSGTDDGFKGEAAKCGSSIIRVANQMVSGKIVHGFTIKESEICDSTTAAQIPMGGYDIHKRRGSKSLPASPLTSPGSSPKANRRSVNKYFTGTFTDIDRSRGSWILSNLLAKREISQSVGYIGEETREDIERSPLTTSMDELAPKSTVFKAKPSELREMNFWSPTSM